MSRPGDRPTSIPGREWVVIGGGFVGSAVTDHLSGRGLRVRQIAAPRLSSAPTSSADTLAAQALDHPATPELAHRLGDAECVILAAGLAQPGARASAALTGANALLPGVVSVAARQQSVGRLVHLSSAAVQGRTRVLTERHDVAPFSAYSRSKALGEAVLSRLDDEPGWSVIVRATSVQGSGRATTEGLRKVARSRISSVAAPGTQPSAVSSIQALCRFIHHVGAWPGSVPPVVLQPWEGLSVAQVLSTSGGRQPHQLPPWLCQGAVDVGYLISRLAAGRLDGSIRRVESMWFGQAVRAEWAMRTGFTRDLALTEDLLSVLADPVAAAG